MKLYYETAQHIRGSEYSFSADKKYSYKDAHNGQILFTYSGIAEGDQKKLADYLAVTKADLPALRFLR
jgi:hypothetical protein